MSLKKECIDMFKLIFKGLSDYEDYCIEEDTVVFLCPEEGYKDSESLICECKESCSKEFVKVDLTVFVPWWAGDEDGGCIYINFCKKPKKVEYRNTIHYISNRKQLIDFIYNLKQRVDDIKNSYAEYAEKIIELREYGQEFLLQVKKDYPVFNGIEGDLPIVFDDFAKDEDGKYDYTVGGNCYIQDIQIIIHIFDCWRDIEILKMTVRHEILHYVLFRIGVNYLDTGGIFHYFCNKYDAHAYKEMPEEEQEIYDALLEQSDKDVCNILNGVKREIVIGYYKE